MVRATRYLQVIDEENLVDKARTTGAYLLGKLHDLQAAHTGLVSNARGLGLMAAFDLPDGGRRDATLEGARKDGLLVVGCGERTVRFRPPLNLTTGEVDEALEIIAGVLGRIA